MFSPFRRVAAALLVFAFPTDRPDLPLLGGKNLTLCFSVFLTDRHDLPLLGGKNLTGFASAK